MNIRIQHMALAAALAVGLPVSMAGIGAAQDFPSRPIEFVVPWGAGGGADQVARKLAKIMEPKLKVSMPIINVPGATGQTGLTKMLTAPADGYSISVFIGDTFALQAGTPPPKWTMQDIEPLGVVIQQPSAFLVAEGGRFKNWADLEAAAKTERLRVGVTGFGSNDDLTVNYLAKKGLKFASVPLPKPGERYTAVLGGHAEVLFEQIGDVRSFVDDKKMKPRDPVRRQARPEFPRRADIGGTRPQGHAAAVPRHRREERHRSQDRQDARPTRWRRLPRDPEYAAYLKDQYADANSFVPGCGTAAFLANELKAMKELIADSGVSKETPAAEKK